MYRGVSMSLPAVNRDLFISSQGKGNAVISHGPLWQLVFFLQYTWGKMITSG